MTDIDRLCDAAETAIEGHADFDTAIDFRSLVRVILQSIREPSEDLEVAMINAFSDPKHKNWDKLPAVWIAGVDYLLNQILPDGR